MSPAEHLVSLVNFAAVYAERGLEVFPVRPDTKAPYTEHGMKEATCDLPTIEAWWRRWPDALVAARVPADQVVLDLDPRHGGTATWQALEDSYSAVNIGRWHASGRGDGGRHLWFKRPPGKLSVKRLNDWARANSVGAAAGKRSWSSGIDLLHHDHRYTILPPSPHPVTGQPYTWGAQGEPGEVPPWLVHYVTLDPEPERPPLRLVADPDSIADWYSAAHSWHDILASEGWTLVDGDGDRDGSKWRHPNASAEHSATVKHGCLFVYSPNTDFPVTEDGDPNGVTRFRAWAILEHDGDLKAAAREAYQLRDGDMGEWREQLERQAKKTLENTVGGTENDPDVLLEILLDWGDFWAQDHAAEEWLVEPFLPARRGVALYAPGGTGKSLLALYVAANLAVGRPVLGRTSDPRSVLYIDYEMTADDLAERLDSMGFGPDIDMSNLHYALMPSLPPLDTPDGGRAVARLAELKNVELVVFDTFARAVAGDENEADTIRNFYRHTGMAIKAAGRGWLRIDHAGKDPDKGARGSSAKRDDVDLVWSMIPRDAGAFTLKATKKRMAWVPETVEILLSEEGDILEFVLPASQQKGWLAGTADAARRLDDLGVPLKVGYRKAGMALRETGEKVANEVVRDAQKYRRMLVENTLELRRNDSGAPTQDPGAPLRRDDPAHHTNMQVDDLRRSSGALGAPNQSSSGAPPLYKSGAAEGPGRVHTPNLLIDDWIEPLEGPDA